MPANRCPNPSCEYFNRALPNNTKVCPWCATPIGNVVAPTSQPPIQPQPSQQPPIQPQPSQQPPIQQPPNQYQRPVTEQPNYQVPQQAPVDYSTVYQPRVPYPPTPPVYTPPPQRAPVLKLIHSTGREYNLLGEGGYIGRRSQSPGIAPPEIDLTGIPNEGIVSRRHARVDWDWSQNAYMIVDMSTNGIYLNNNPLTPGMQYRLLNGDALRFGQDNLVNFTVYVM
ncbi:FHA domain-containing protein [Nostoc sp. FACHB-973]|uniref:FHA domain-containing protein n=1 Tax=Desmonostoc muscorum LEGE 12446 TaxID=1828758 RepID=A0A8J7DCU1_DESMC|nr:FHA domain-containing protein [Desmonostoc muscorum]MBD2518655.1 FHA domain-containing protein [Nostoc sp. FACHB-973]MBX9259500.1 FHA domain-containing protein [Desmonostoc muscorum CCALA 125]MCF2149746.1 FHA domain-containing protein [Desmonostoc muscorum LEGE 12446]